MHFLQFLEQITVILLTGLLCPTLYSHLEAAFNRVENALYVPDPEVKLDIALKHIACLCIGCTEF